MPKRAHYFDRYGREVAEHEAMRNGTLRDQFSMRVPTVFRDSRFRDGRELWDSGQLVCTDADATGRSGNAPGWRVSDSPINRQEIADAYVAYRYDLENQWRTPPRDAFGSYPYTGAAEGSACTVNGAAGRLVKERGVLVCRPISADARTDERDCPDCDGTGEIDGEACERCDGTGELDDDDDGETTSDRRVLDVNAISTNHQQRMQRLYDAHARELSEAWKGNK